MSDPSATRAVERRGVWELVHRAAGETGLVDLGRTYVLGHSYRGYLVNRIVTNEHPFRAAVLGSASPTCDPPPHLRELLW